MTTPHKTKAPTQTELKNQLTEEILQDTDGGILYRMRDNAPAHTKELLTLLGLSAPWGYVPTDIVRSIVRRVESSLGKGAFALNDPSPGSVQIPDPPTDLSVANPGSVQIPGFLGSIQVLPPVAVGSPTKEELEELNAFRTTGELEFTIHYDVGTGVFTAPPPARTLEDLTDQYTALCSALPAIATEAACSELQLLLEVWDVDGGPPECSGPTKNEIQKRIDDLRAANDYPTDIARLLDRVDELEQELANQQTQVEGPGGLEEKAAILDWIIDKGTDPNIDPKNFERALRNILHQSQFMGDDYPDILSAFRAALRVK